MLAKPELAHGDSFRIAGNPSSRRCDWLSLGVVGVAPVETIIPVGCRDFTGSPLLFHPSGMCSLPKRVLSTLPPSQALRRGGIVAGFLDGEYSKGRGVTKEEGGICV